MYKTVVKLFSKLQNIKSMEYYSAIKIIIMKTFKNKEKRFHYDVKRINAELKCIELYFSTDLRQLEPEMNKTLISFKQDPETGRYRMELAEIPLLENK